MKKAKYIVLLSAIFLLYVAVSWHVLKKSQVARVYDESYRISYGISLSRSLFAHFNSNSIEKLKSVILLDEGQGHPHFFELIEAFSWKILEVIKIWDVDAMILAANAVFLLFLLIGIYGIGSILYNKNAGLLAALLTVVFPLVCGQSRIAMLDYPLMSMTALSMYLLLKTKGFRSLGFSVLAGVVFGLSQSTKETFILFIFAPLAYYFVRAFVTGEKKKTGLHFAIFMSLFLLSLVPYAAGAHIVESYTAKIFFIKQHTEFLYYPANCRAFTGPFVLFLCLPLLLSYVLNIRQRDKVLFLWLFVPLILFSIPPNKSFRFILPLLPAVALTVTGELFANLLLRKIRDVGLSDNSDK